MQQYRDSRSSISPLAKLNRVSPLRYGLKHLYHFNQTTGASPASNLIDGNQLSFGGDTDRRFDAWRKSGLVAMQTGQGSGAANYLQIPNCPAMDADSTYTLVIKFSTMSLTVNHDLISQKDGTGTGTTILNIEPDANYLSAWVSGSEHNSTFVPVADRWYTISLTKNGSSYTFWVDGTSYGTITATAPAATGEIIIGNSKTPVNTYQFQGSIMGIAIHDRYLLPFEIALLHNDFFSLVDNSTEYYMYDYAIEGEYLPNSMAVFLNHYRNMGMI